MSIPALVVNQWLSSWNEAIFEPAPPRGKPEPHFYIFSISAYDLRQLSGIYRRDPNLPPAKDLGIQRRHDREKSDEILRYFIDGFPLSRINIKKLVDPKEAASLRMPGWLPTSIIANILTTDDKRGPDNVGIDPKDLVHVKDAGNGTTAEIVLPPNYVDSKWQPQVHPIEIIDGQHRLWALDEDPDDPWTPEFRERIKSLQVPVVAFHGLDRTWQAYLFYTINQLPKRIDRNVVFDLYPLLRTEDWLTRFEGPNIYRETRSQDLTIVLWSHPESPWKDRIIRLEGRSKGKVGQAAYIQSLMASFVRNWKGKGQNIIGGLFGAAPNSHQLELE